jgi:hypothetical protein
VLSCGQEALTDPPVQQRPRPGDLVIGPLLIVDGRELATADPAGFFAQGFAFTDGRTRGCPPLDVSIDHQPQVRHVTLSPFAGSCAR